MKHGRRDEHHVKAGELARAVGFSTLDTGDAGDGFPDWVWGKNALNFLVEIKTGPKAKLKPKQLELALTYRGQWVRADTPEEAVQLALLYVDAFKKKVDAGDAWNARPVLTAAERLEWERSRAVPGRGRKGGRVGPRAPRRGR